MIAARRFWISVFMFIHGAGTIHLVKWVVDRGFEVTFPILFFLFFFFVGPICVSFLSVQAGILLGATNQLRSTSKDLVATYKNLEADKLRRQEEKVKWM